MSRARLTSRPATREDCAAIAAIYNAGIAERSATFETRPRTPEDIAGWLGGRHPVMVVEEEGRVVAFASSSAYSPRECYAGVADFSIYVAPEARGRGAGRLALQSLLEAVEAAGFHKLTSRVFATNTRSRAMLAGLGFREVGLHEKHAPLNGVWQDVVVVEKLLPATLR
ncbi:arsinothricin resistance N-acetyltransferase ArsN1 family A [Myxococcus sp. RHSTA-1-4]|uniref:arsinothricin resistance N-acetyltransferase ArsN1 family A n=1 Tax=Myxococcus sp. RHSTA-1-4 TaxID=2874601 RepID=UPI001CC0E88D|nr:arsinothricin resistance N-acetyltransferase ArsN1 family A [Myxococcus sp. RHSTA-1-4]MBZ4419200.1 arsinothricin resistance N-acetyltransferase ArsN1 [Myxococcus sp. RHSTA-1-4]